MRQSVYGLGETAAKLLVERMNENAGEAKRIVLRTEAVYRVSIVGALV